MLLNANVVLANYHCRCYAEWILMHFFIWFFFPWNFKVNIIIEAILIYDPHKRTHHIDHVISCSIWIAWLCLIFFLFQLKWKWHAMHAINMPPLLFSHILLTALAGCACVHVCVYRFVSQTMTEIFACSIYT